MAQRPKAGQGLRKDTVYRCFTCGWYIGGVLLDEDHYVGACPNCDYEVDISFIPKPEHLRELNKRLQAGRKT
jgi:DNA-directed RNA polymerase subunit RPC12/RpoP